jgi:DNA-binding NtrC family response regulator
MRALVLDEAFDLAPQVSRFMAGRAVEATVVCSPYEFEMAAASRGPFDLRVINLGGHVSAWEMARQLKSTDPAGPTLVLFDERGAQGLEHLACLQRVSCVRRPGTLVDLDALVARTIEEASRLREPVAQAPVQQIETFADIIGESPQIREVFAKIVKVAPGTANVCIVGESGTGKELVARAIHYNSERRDHPLVTLDCTAVPEGLMESHLFGHVRGSFTGAVENRDGVFSLAHTGTLFIDEISELTLPLQAKLLRVIQTREFVKVGGSKPIRTDIRLIAASNKDLRQAVEEGTFREDLYYRIAVVMIQMPALRERRGDIPLLVRHFLEKFTAAHRKTIRGIAPRAMELLTSYAWPGNVRQLENCIEQAVVLCEDETIGVENLSLGETGTRREVDSFIKIRTGLPLEDVEREYILRTLQETGGNRTRAARVLGISLRCLQYKLKAYAEASAAEAISPPGRRIEAHPMLGV